MYAPQLGRFIGRDPVQEWPLGDLYQYTNSRPLVGLDPSGAIAHPFGFEASGKDRLPHTITQHPQLDGIGVGCCSGTLTISYAARYPNFAMGRNNPGAHMKLSFVEDAGSNCCSDVSGPLGWTQQLHESITEIPFPKSLSGALGLLEDLTSIVLFETEEHSYNLPFESNPFQGWVDDMFGKIFVPGGIFEDSPALPGWNPQFPKRIGIGVLKEFRTSLTCGGFIPVGLDVSWSFQGYTGQPNRTKVRGTVN